MAHIPGRGHEALRRGRWSAPGAEYFLTVCTSDRKPGLSEPGMSAQLSAAALQLEQESVWIVRTMIVMPDHIHLLVNLGPNTELSSAIRLYKGRLAGPLRSSGLRWERGCFDHRLRDKEDRLPAFLYVFLNPYRAKLISAGQRWPGYYCSAGDWTWFEPLTDSSRPFPEWLL